MDLAMPHLVRVYPPSRTRQDTNGTDTVYQGVSPVEVNCNLQARAGRAALKAGGLEFNYDAVMWTYTLLTIDSLVVQSVAGFDADHRFLVAGVEPKFDTDGEFSHYHVQLTRTEHIARPT